MALNSTPRTWAANERPTAALLNTEVRDALAGIQAAWSDYPATVATGGTPITIGNGSIVASFIRFGKTVHFQVLVTAGSTTNWGAGNVTITLPVTIAPPGNTLTGTAIITSPNQQAMLRSPSTILFHLHEVGTTGIADVASLGLTTTSTIIASGSYEAA